MSALPRMRIAGSTEPLWLNVSEAAQRSGMSDRHVRRLAADVWMNKGLARMDGSHYLVREDADPSFSPPPPTPKATMFDIARCPPDQQQVILHREQIVTELRAFISASPAGKDRAIETFAALHPEYGSKRSLWSLLGRYEKLGREGLLDLRRKSATSPDDSKVEFWQIFDKLYLTERRLKPLVAWEIACEAATATGVPIMHYSQVAAHIRRIPQQTLAMKREGDKAYQDRYSASIRRDYTTIESNDLWNADHHRLDVMVIVGKKDDGTPIIDRPWLTAWQDVRSRKIVGYEVYHGDPEAKRILRVFAKAVREHGVPKAVYFDNGKDFDSKILQGVTKRQRKRGESPSDPIGAFRILQVSVQHAWTYHGQSKPIERFFGTLCERCAKLADTYVGKDTSSKPSDLYDRIDAGQAPTLAEFAESVKDWIEGDYHHRVHTGHGMNGLSPADAWQRFLITKRTCTEEMLRFACLPRYGPFTVRKDGIRFNYEDYGKFLDPVIRLFGQKVFIAADDEDLREVLVLDAAGNLICAAGQNERAGFSINGEDVKEGIRQKRSAERVAREHAKHRTRIALDPAELARRAAARRHANAAKDSGEPLPPATINAIQTGLEGQSDLIRSLIDRREPMRRAVNDPSDNAQLPDLTSSLTIGPPLKLAGGWDDEDGGDLMDSLISPRSEGSDE